MCKIHLNPPFPLRNNILYISRDRTQPHYQIRNFLIPLLHFHIQKCPQKLDNNQIKKQEQLHLSSGTASFHFHFHTVVAILKQGN